MLPRTPAYVCLPQFSRAKVEHQAWLRTLEATQAAAAAATEELEKEKDGPATSSSSSDKAAAAATTAAAAGGSQPQMPWPEPDFYRIHVVAQDGVLVGSGLDSDGSVAVHTVECGTVVVAYER